ncbi:MAG: 1-acyl-sn-glycerol-3-phosphate acyltransferase [Kordiimonadaceae bacterium]|nr:1-acyl-sn-glycerol-3-phosphate acyltransferase [Kordiimonadaceae bacterium]MBO6568793.1 1-acyl-sn-glycerol-3-phosphate acyltransferase [Kordiimonadaceae bacterium]MBO6965232.1 1-acyl-sn-glycerol-3-phosphate acyltransferase [Kordiimonadaceae bacterium]
MKLSDRIRSLFFNIVFYPFTLLFCGLVVAPMCFAKTDGPVRKGIGWYCQGSLWVARICSGIKFEYRNAKGMPKDGTLIICAAHQSNMDPILTYPLRSDVTALAKKELFKIPFIGSIIKKAQIIRIDRQSKKAHKAMDSVTDHMRETGRPLIVYPQATRVAIGKSRPLKSGAYYLYKDSGLKVVPVSTNTGLFWTRGFWHRAGTAVFQVGDPFPEGLSKEEFMARVHEEVVVKSNELVREAGYGHLLPEDADKQIKAST